MVVNGIDTKDISVVVQGAVDMSYTPLCIKSIRKYLPDSEIVLSTWEGSTTTDLDYDVLQLNKDPGTIRCNYGNDNSNRQILSTKNGLKRCSRPFALKMRSDCELRNSDILKYWDLYPKREQAYRWFSHRVIIPTLYCKRYLNQESLIPVPFHFSDWLQFGLIKDIKKIWNIPLITEKDYGFYFLNNRYAGAKLRDTYLYSRLAPESYIYSSAVRKSFSSINYNSLADYSSKNIEQSEKILTNNFILVEPEHLGIILRKQPYCDQIQDIEKFRQPQPDCLYSEKQFIALYEVLRDE